ncbi:hypothetical protein AC249_AIPGENE26007 [Exaiptasia diaphana]|nr:hypothetical protein AC249_AIPGENE26007 [Exaiptasia diaphana]
MQFQPCCQGEVTDVKEYDCQLQLSLHFSIRETSAFFTRITVHVQRGCITNLNGDSGELSINETYLSRPLNCSWTIGKGTSDIDFIVIKFEPFDLGNHCFAAQRKYVEISDVNQQFKVKECGGGRPFEVLIKRRSAVVRFYSEIACRWGPYSSCSHDSQNIRLSFYVISKKLEELVGIVSQTDENDSIGGAAAFDVVAVVVVAFLFGSLADKELLSTPVSKNDKPLLYLATDSLAAAQRKYVEVSDANHQFKVKECGGGRSFEVLIKRRSAVVRFYSEIACRWGPYSSCSHDSQNIRLSFYVISKKLEELVGIVSQTDENDSIGGAAAFDVVAVVVVAVLFGSLAEKELLSTPVSKNDKPLLYLATDSLA